MSSLTDQQQRKLVDELVSTVRQFTPSWTAPAQGDPGVTFLELFAWLAETLLYRQGGLSDLERASLLRLRDKLAALCQDCCAASGLTRLNFFSGRLLTASDFQEEQDYTRKMMWLHHRCLFGTGIVQGLGVSLDPDAAPGGPAVIVSHGCAIDATGRELNLCEPLRCVLRVRGASGYVVLRYSEQAIDPVPTPDGPAEPSRIREGVAVDFAEHLPVDGVALACIQRTAKKWRLDRKFRPAKIKSAS